MNRFIDIAAVLGAAMLLAACTIERDVHLYPANDMAAATGVINARLVGHGTLHGTMEATMPDGELLQGEYSIVAGGSVNFGNIFGSVYGPRGITSISGTTTGVTMGGSGEGQASLFGNRGTSIHCEFMNNNMFGHGYGACQSSKGAVYRMEY